MSKGKINIDSHSKISNFVAKKQQKEEQENLGFAKPKKIKHIIKSFRLNLNDLDKLQTIVAKINNDSPYKNYTDSEVLRGLIEFATHIPHKKILKAISISSYGGDL